MASSIIKKTLNFIKNYEGTKYDVSLFTVGRIAVLCGSIYSGSDGIAQYNQTLYKFVPSNYLPSAPRRCITKADNGQEYGYQVQASGSVQSMTTIPSDVTLTIFCSWKY